MHWLSVVIPVRNEAEGITQVLCPLQGLRDQLEIIVVDGGSEDATTALAAPLADKVLTSPPGRARQMNAGAAAATGEVLLFLHADTQLPEGFLGMIRAVIPTTSIVTPDPHPVIPAPPYVIPAQAGIQADVQQTKESHREHSAHPHPTMDPRVREDDGGGESGASVPGTAGASHPVIPAPHTVTPITSIVIPTTSIVTPDPHPVTPAPPYVIPAQAGIQADVQQTKESHREHPAHPHPTMDLRLREDDGGGESGASVPGTAGASHPVIPAPHTVTPVPPTVIPAPPYVIPAQAGIQTDVQQTKESHREHPAHPHPTMDPRVREDDGGGESGASVPGTAGASHPVIPAPPTVTPVPPTVIPAPPYVIPAQAGIQADVQQTKESHREHSAHPHPTMDPRVREDDGGGESGASVPGTAGASHPVIPAPQTVIPVPPTVTPAPPYVIPAQAGIHSDLDRQHQWGRFNVRLAPSSPTLRLVGWMMNQRSRLTGICTGDQALFVRRNLFNQLGGYADIPLMEDIELSKRLKRITPPACIRQPLTTSSRRWQTQGVLRTIVLMWWLRLQYWAGVSPAKLVKKYYPARPSSE